MKRSNTCGTCQHWQPPKDNGEFGECTIVNNQRETFPLAPLAMALDNEGYGIDLLSQASFGCVQWEGKLKIIKRSGPL